MTPLPKIQCVSAQIGVGLQRASHLRRALFLGGHAFETKKCSIGVMDNRLV